MRRIVSLSALALLCAASNAYTVTFLSQTVTAEPLLDGWTNSIPDLGYTTVGYTRSVTSSNSGKTAVYGLQAEVEAYCFNDYGFYEDGSPKNQPGGTADYIPVGGWTIKSQFQFVPSYSGEIPPISGLQVQYDVKVNRYAQTYCYWIDRPPLGKTATLQADCTAGLFESAFSDLHAFSQIVATKGMSQWEDPESDGINQYVDAGFDTMTGIAFTLQNGRWIGEATLQRVQSMELKACFLVGDSGVPGPWDIKSAGHVLYQITPTKVGTASV